MIVCLMFACAVLGYSEPLPDELLWPRPVHGSDSGALSFSTDQSLLDNSFAGINNIFYRTERGSVFIEQGLWYEMRRDRLSNTRHYLNTSGALSRTLAGYPWITPGLDWTPVAQHSTDKSGSSALTTIDIGPTLKLDLAGVPVNLRGGMLGRRVDELSSWIKVGEYRSSVGAYGGFKVGSEEHLLPFGPVYFYADGIGRQIEKSGMASLTSSVLGALKMGESDSIYIYGGASLFNGRAGYLEESADARAMLFANTPWRIEQNTKFTAGYKGGRKHIFNPSAYYTVSENKLEFPDGSLRRDEKTTGHTLSGTIFTDTTMNMYYSGKISFEWKDHDKLFKNELPLTITAGNADSLELNLWDYKAFIPHTAHQITVRLPRSLALKYGISLNRFLTEYPNFYLKDKDTVANKDDSDRKTETHRLAFEYNNDSTLKAEVYGELVDYTLVFLKQARSGANRTDKTQRVGLLLEWSPAASLLLSEAAGAEAKKGDFHFPLFHQEALQRPRFSRALTSVTAALWQFTSQIGLKGEWSIKYSDYGFWYGKEYMEEILADDSRAKTDFYAIASKSIYYTIDISVQLRLKRTMWEIGNAFTDARDRNYSGGSYIVTNYNGYTAKPYFTCLAQIGEKVNMAAQLSHTFVKTPNTSGYWDFRLQMEGGFW